VIGKTCSIYFIIQYHLKPARIHTSLRFLNTTFEYIHCNHFNKCLKKAETFVQNNFYYIKRYITWFLILYYKANNNLLKSLLEFLFQKVGPRQTRLSVTDMYGLCDPVVITK